MSNPTRQVTQGKAGSIHTRQVAPEPDETIGERSATCPWVPIIFVYCCYAIVTLIGGITGINLQIIGAMGFLLFVGVQYGRYIFPIPISGLTIALLVSCILPLTATLTGATLLADLNLGYWAKYAALYFLVLLTANLNLPPLSKSRTRFWGLGTVLGLLMIGAMAPGGASGERLQSVFANPNNFALAAMSLLFFIDHNSDSMRFKAALHSIALAFILLSGTVGALLGYMAGAFAWLTRTKYARAAYLTVLVAGSLVVLFFLSARSIDPQKLERWGPVGDMMLKVCAVVDVLNDRSRGSEINYWDVGKEYGGAESTSALWRIMHWRETLITFQHSSWLERLLGHGVGSSEAVTGRLPHNDYLRMLLEVGLIGLLANIAVWLLIYVRVDPSSRWVCVMMAVYAFTENNLDNFLVMSLFVLFVVSARAAPGNVHTEAARQ